jgi:hypothetical protein
MIVPIALQIALQVLLPAFLVVVVWTDRSGSRGPWLLKVIAVGSVVLFVFLTARRDFTSYFLRYDDAIRTAASAWLVPAPR